VDEGGVRRAAAELGAETENSVAPADGEGAGTDGLADAEALRLEAVPDDLERVRALLRHRGAPGHRFLGFRICRHR